MRLSHYYAVRLLGHEYDAIITDHSKPAIIWSGVKIWCVLREFVRTTVILTPAREASRVGTALCRQDPQDPLDPVDPQECSFLLEFETPIEV